jgi:hypothetical protein
MDRKFALDIFVADLHHWIFPLIQGLGNGVSCVRLKRKFGEKYESCFAAESRKN